jgi:iron-hydrogenase subunit beta
VSGLWASPTVINNVETLANLPDIVQNGADWFRSIGPPDNPGTKLVSLAGDVRHPGLYEVPLGTPLQAIVDTWGGGTSGRLNAVLVGGPSGSILPASLAETPFDVSPLQAVGGILGAGGVVALNEQRCVVRVVRDLVAFNARESCGKCTPCREGTLRMKGLFDDLIAGVPSGSFLNTLEYLNDVVAGGSLCGLGQMAPNPVRALVRHFGEEVGEHLNGGCRAGVCTFARNEVVTVQRPPAVAAR